MDWQETHWLNHFASSALHGSMRGNQILGNDIEPRSSSVFSYVCVLWCHWFTQLQWGRTVAANIHGEGHKEKETSTTQCLNNFSLSNEQEKSLHWHGDVHTDQQRDLIVVLLLNFMLKSQIYSNKILWLVCFSFIPQMNHTILFRWTKTVKRWVSQRYSSVVCLENSQDFMMVDKRL